MQKKYFQDVLDLLELIIRSNMFKTRVLKDYFYLDEIIDIVTLYILVFGKF